MITSQDLNTIIKSQPVWWTTAGTLCRHIVMASISDDSARFTTLDQLERFVRYFDEAVVADKAIEEQSKSMTEEEKIEFFLRIANARSPNKS